MVDEEEEKRKKEEEEKENEKEEGKEGEVKSEQIEIPRKQEEPMYLAAYYMPLTHLSLSWQK